MVKASEFFGMPANLPEPAPVRAPAQAAPAMAIMQGFHAEVPATPAPAAPPMPTSAAQLARRVHADNGTPDDEPIKALHLEFGRSLDEFRTILAGFGPDAAKQAADAAAFAASQTVSDRLDRAIFHVGFLRFGTWIVGVATVAILTFSVARSLPHDSPIGIVPAVMGRTLQYQDWQSQFAACVPQPAKNGLEWCLMPYVTKTPSVNELVVKR